MKKIVIIFLIVVSAYQWFESKGSLSEGVSQHSTLDNVIENAYQEGLSDVQVTGEGTVIKLLTDDNDGSRHQKFILRLSSGQTLLMAHNIDLSRRINSIATGDKVQFKGEYEWNNKGGVVHWTHRDPNGRHINGWLQHEGDRYE